MAYDIRTRRLFILGINTESEVLGIIKRMQKLIAEKTTMGWNGEGDSETLEFGLPPDVVISEGIYFLQSYYPLKYGYIATKSRQIRY